LDLHHELMSLAKTLAVALAVGLDVLAVSVGVGIAQVSREASLRLGLSFAGSEITMQVVGYQLGVGAGKVLGEIGSYAGFVLLAAVGVFLIRESLHEGADPDFEATRGFGLILTSLSISLDSLGVGAALPAVAIPLLPLLIMLSITTTCFTMIGLNFGARLGQPSPTLSFHLNQLRFAGLVRSRRASRSIIYSANFKAMTDLIGYLTECCCGGRPEQCAPMSSSCASLVCASSTSRSRKSTNRRQST
jgi:putative Mn2+ efflux pump MntP